MKPLRLPSTKPLTGLEEIQARCAASAAAGSSTVQRLVESSASIFASSAERIDYQHSALCQLSMPYNNPGDDVREWEREQGAVSLLIEAGHAKDPRTSGFVKLGLPFGEKVRLVLIHLNSEAVRTGSPEIEVEDSMTSFVASLGLATHGRNIRTIKDQLARLAAAHITLGRMREGRAETIKAEIVRAFDLWFPKEENQRVLWPSTVRLSQEYFEDLARHAVPLDHRAVRALAHSAMALDVYVWLAQRLHRVPSGRPQFIAWSCLKEQFGCGYGRMDNFKRCFRAVLDTVQTQYRNAKLSVDGRGATLYHSSPPVPKAVVQGTYPRSLGRSGAIS